MGKIFQANDNQKKKKKAGVVISDKIDFKNGKNIQRGSLYNDKGDYRSRICNNLKCLHTQH